MTKQIEDYPVVLSKDLSEWVADNCYTTKGAPIVENYLNLADVEQKLLEMQSKIEELTEQNSNMTDVMANNGWLSKEVVRLTEQNKELEKLAESRLRGIAECEVKLNAIKRAASSLVYFTHPELNKESK